MAKTHLLTHKFHDTEQGSVLVIALVILLVLTMMAIAGVQSTSIQERMAGNIRDKDISFQAAEAALRDAEWYIENEYNDLEDEDCYYTSSVAFDANSTKWCNHFSSNFSNLYSPPQFFIQRIDVFDPDLGIPGNVQYRYLITSRSGGRSKDTETVLETFYKPRSGQ